VKAIVRPGRDASERELDAYVTELCRRHGWMTYLRSGRIDLALADHSNCGLVASASPQLVRRPSHPGPQARLSRRSHGATRRGDRDHQLVAGPMFLLYVFVPLAVTTLLASIAAAPRLRHPASGFL